jgi:hypothetical protein
MLEQLNKKRLRRQDWLRMDKLSTLKEVHVQRTQRCLTSLFLGAALIVPIGAQAFNPLDDHDHDKKARRYYDREHKDYHNWDAREDAAYRHWLTEERHERYRNYARINRERQAEYWRWRHEHPDWH